jgi:integrase
MDAWEWEQLRPRLTSRRDLPVSGHCLRHQRSDPWTPMVECCRARRGLASQAGVRRRFAPHQLRHADALELAREGVPLNIIQRQLGHANLGTTSIYLQVSIPRRSSPRLTAAGPSQIQSPDLACHLAWVVTKVLDDGPPQNR